MTNVYHVPFDDKLAESTANAIQHVAETKDCNIVLGTSTKFGSTVIPRAAALLDVSPITDILEIHDESKCNYTSELYHTHIYIHHSFTQSFFINIVSLDTFVRPMYAGNVMGKVSIKDPTKRKVLSVRPTSFDKADLQDASGVETIDSAVSSYF